MFRDTCSCIVSRLIGKIEKQRNDEQLKLLEKRDCISHTNKMEGMSNRQSLLKSFKAGNCIGHNKRLGKTSDSEILLDRKS